MTSNCSLLVYKSLILDSFTYMMVDLGYGLALGCPYNKDMN